MPKCLRPETDSIADDLDDFFVRWVLNNPEGPRMDRLVERVRKLERRADELGEEMLEQGTD